MEEEELLRSCSQATFFSKSAESQPSQHQRDFDKNINWGFIYMFSRPGISKSPANLIKMESLVISSVFIPITRFGVIEILCYQMVSYW